MENESRYPATKSAIDQLEAAVARVKAEIVSARPTDLAAVASRIYKARRRRDDAFDGFFGEPAYDMLLDLFCARANNARVSVSALGIASGAPGTTALRWIEAMLDRGLIVREPDTLDGRRSWVRLTEKGLRLMTQHLEDLRD